MSVWCGNYVSLHNLKIYPSPDRAERTSLEKTKKDSKPSMMWCPYFSNVLNKIYYRSQMALKTYKFLWTPHFNLCEKKSVLTLQVSHLSPITLDLHIHSPVILSQSAGWDPSKLQLHSKTQRDRQWVECQHSYIGIIASCRRTIYNSSLYLLIVYWSL